MTFIDMLRSARESRVAVLHEFLAQYDPMQKRVHAFFEGYDDITFFSAHIERFLPEGFRLITYRCEGKSRVLEVFVEITRRTPDIRLALFFVDKDLDDVLGTPWPTDPRIFTTDVYSIENYVVNSDALTKLYRDHVRPKGIAFNDAEIAEDFDKQLVVFHRRMLCVMGWILVLRRAGQRPNLSNLDLSVLYRVLPGGRLRPIRGTRLRELTRITGVPPQPRCGSRVRDAVRELARMPAKRIVRGKFEAWFFVQYWRALTEYLRKLSVESGGRVQVKLSVTGSTLVPALTPYTVTPRALELFLRSHLRLTPPSGSAEHQDRRGMPWWRRLLRFRR